MARFNTFPLISFIALGAALPAFAQTPAPQAPPPESERADDVIIVTASKREETVQDVALAVTAITDTMRDEIGLQTVQDYTNFTPGLSYDVANDRVGMRGITRSSNNFGIRSGISNYIDGVYSSSTIPGGRESIFVDRVEVVRGPQGTLYGRDAIGGAVNVISKRPTDDFEGQFNIGMGSYDSLKVETTFSGPITDWLRFRINGSRTAQNEGYFTNYSGNESEGGRNDGYFLEGQLEGNIGDNFEWWTRYGSIDWKNRLGAPGGLTDGGPAQPYDTRFTGPSLSSGVLPNADFGFINPNSVMVGNQRTNPGAFDRWSFNADDTESANLPEENEFAFEGIYHAPGFDIKYVGGYNYYVYHLLQEFDNTPVQSFPFSGPGFPTSISPRLLSDYTENRGWFSNELNFLSTWDGPLQVIGGLYQYQENYTQPSYVYLAEPVNVFSPAQSPRLGTNGAPIGVQGLVSVPGAPNSSLSIYTNSDGITHAYGAFVQGDYQINEQFKVTAGIRYSKDISKIDEHGRLICYYVCGLTTGALRVDLTDFTWSGIDPSTGFAGPGVQNVTASNPSGASTDSLGNRRRRLEGSWSEVTGVLGLDWTPFDDTLIYGKYNRGYKPGGFGAATVGTNFNALPMVDQELVNAYELGAKQTFDALNLTANAVLFFYDYEGYQVPNVIVPATGPAFTAFVNLPKVNSTGFELETTWNPLPPLRILFNYAFLNPEIGDSQPLVDAVDPGAFSPGAQPIGPNNAGNQGQNLAGNLLPFSPKNKVAVNGTYTWDNEDGSSITASASYFWQDVSYGFIFNRYYHKAPAWDQVDGRVIWRSPDSTFSVIGWVSNLLDEIGYSSRVGGRRFANPVTGQALAPSALELATCGSTADNSVSHTSGNPLGSLRQSCVTYTDSYRPPRTWGVDLQFRF